MDNEKNADFFLREFSGQKIKCKPTIKLSTRNCSTVTGSGI